MKIEYSIVSPGTERAGSKGYMAITELIDNNRYLLPLPHNTRECVNIFDELKCGEYSITNIAFSRFELIVSLALDKLEIEDKILLCGMGSVGIATLIHLLDLGKKDINVYLRKTSKYIEEIVCDLQMIYQANIKLIKDFEKCEVNTIVDTTGSGEVIKKIFSTDWKQKVLFLIGTPRNCNYQIDPLLIHRNNWILIGGHELRGITKEKRNIEFKKLLNKNRNNEYLERIVEIKEYSELNYADALNKKSKLIVGFKYEN